MSPDLSSAHSNGNGHAKQEAGASFGIDDPTSILAKLTSTPTFDSYDEEREYLKERLVSALRIFAHLGYDNHIAGHLTVRDPDPDRHTFWVNPFGLSFRLMTIPDLIEVDEDGKVVGGGKPGRQIVNLAGFCIHSAIHKARPDVKAICHSHSPYGKAFSSLGKDLEITTQDACTFYNDLAVLKSFGGVVIKGEEGDLIAKTLQNKKAIILQNHGLLTTGQSIDSAVAWFIQLEQECQVNLLADAAAAREGNSKPVPIDEPQAQFTYKETGSERAGVFMASPYFDTIEYLQGKEYLRKYGKLQA